MDEQIARNEGPIFSALNATVGVACEPVRKIVVSSFWAVPHFWATQQSVTSWTEQLAAKLGRAPAHFVGAFNRRSNIALPASDALPSQETFLPIIVEIIFVLTTSTLKQAPWHMAAMFARNYAGKISLLETIPPPGYWLWAVGLERSV